MDALAVMSPDGTSRWLLLQDPSRRQWWGALAEHGEAATERPIGAGCRYARARSTLTVAVSACASTVAMHSSTSSRVVSVSQAGSTLVWTGQLGTSAVGGLHVHSARPAAAELVLTAVVSSSTTYRLEASVGVGNVTSAVVVQVSPTSWLAVVCGNTIAESVLFAVGMNATVTVVEGVDQCRSVGLDEDAVIVVGSNSWHTVESTDLGGVEVVNVSDPGGAGGLACSWRSSILVMAVCSEGTVKVATNTSAWRVTGFSCTRLDQGLGSPLCAVDNGTSTVVLDLEGVTPGASQYGAVESRPVGVYVADGAVEPEMIVITASSRLLRYRFDLDPVHTVDFAERSLRAVPLHPTARANALSGTFDELWGSPKINSSIDGASSYFTLQGDDAGTWVPPDDPPTSIVDPDADYVLVNATRVVRSEGGVLVDYNTSSNDVASVSELLRPLAACMWRPRP